MTPVFPKIILMSIDWGLLLISQLTSLSRAHDTKRRMNMLLRSKVVLSLHTITVFQCTKRFQCTLVTNYGSASFPSFRPWYSQRVNLDKTGCSKSIGGKLPQILSILPCKTRCIKCFENPFLMLQTKYEAFF